MSQRFSQHLLLSSSHEPEGLYLSAPLEGTFRLLQNWGENPAFHNQFTYFGVPLKGHPGLDLVADAGTNVLAVDDGRVVEINQEPGGLGRYLKIEHRWGESLYANLGEILVESGKHVSRGVVIARLEPLRRHRTAHLHFAIRIAPFNRFDGWGGFSDPLPYLFTNALVLPEPDTAGEGEPAHSAVDLPPMVVERPGMRRP